MTGPVPDTLEILRERLGTLLERTAVGDDVHDIAAEALEALAVAVEERRTHDTERAGNDITAPVHDRQSNRATDELRASEARLRALVETAQVGMVLCDVDGSVVFSNRYADGLLGRPRDRLDLDHWMSNVHDDDRAEVEEMIMSAGRGGDARSRRYRIESLEGPTQWVDQTTTPRWGRGDEIEGSVSTLIDSTAEVDAAAGLRRSRDFADALLDTAGAMAVVLDRDGRIVRFNKACEQATGWTSSEAIGRLVAELLVPPEQQASVEQLVLDMLSNASPTSLEHDWVTKDGRLLRISWHNTAVVDDGEVLVIIATGIEVTRQRMLESRLAQTDRLESVGRLAAGIAHDFNNTLAVLRLRIERLAATDQAQRDNVDALMRTIEHSQSTIADLLSFSRHQDFVPAPTDVNGELRRHVAMFHDVIGDDIELVMELTDDDSTTLLDPARFEQIIVNLVVNARDAMVGGGKLTVQTMVIDIGEARAAESGSQRAFPATLADGSYLCVSVADTGTGIRPDDITHVFDPYFTTKPSGRGTGLGLATAYGTVTQSGGELVVESEVGRGTTFTMWLPLQRTAGGDEGAPVASRSAIVLLAEDDDDLREILADELALLGCHTIEASDGVAGLGEIHHPIDLLVTDVQMPGMDGVALAEAFAHGSPRARVLFVTGLTPKELRDRLPSGADVLPKPFSAAEFRAAVTELLARWT